MTGATETLGAMAAREAEREKMQFEHQMDAFIRCWGPKDERDSRQFQIELMSIMRQVYSDAQGPVLDRLTKIATAHPMPHFVFKDGKVGE